MVNTSARAWQGWYVSHRALMTGAADHRANSATVECEKTRAAIPCTQRSRLRATSFSGSRTPMGPSQNTEVPPICRMASSKVSRVRSEGFSKSSAIDLPASASAKSRGVRFTSAARSNRYESSSLERSRSVNMSGAFALRIWFWIATAAMTSTSSEYLSTKLNNHTFLAGRQYWPAGGGVTHCVAEL